MSSTWTTVFSDSFTRGPQTAGNVGNGWQDENGSWQINSSNVLEDLVTNGYIGYASEFLLSPVQVNMLSTGQQISVNCTYDTASGGNASPHVLLGWNPVTNTGYGCHIYGGQITIERWDDHSGTGAYLSSGLTGTLPSTGTAITLQFQAIQTTLGSLGATFLVNVLVGASVVAHWTTTDATYALGPQCGVCPGVNSGNPITGITLANYYNVVTGTATPIYINSSTGNDATGTGAIGAPFASLQKANMQQLPAGGSLNFEGTFTVADPLAGVILSEGNCVNATAAAPIRVRSYGTSGVQAAITLTASPYPVPVYASDVSNVFVENLGITSYTPSTAGTGTDTALAGILFNFTNSVARASNVKAIGNTIIGGQAAIALLAANSSNSLLSALVGCNIIEIAGNVCSHAAGYSIVTSEPTFTGIPHGNYYSYNYYNHFSGLYVHHNSCTFNLGNVSTDQSGLGSGIRIYCVDLAVPLCSDDVNTYGTVVSRNYVNFCGADCTGANGPAGIYADGSGNVAGYVTKDGQPGSQGILFHKNIVLNQSTGNVDGSGINVGVGCANCTVESNLVAYCDLSGILYDGYHPTGFSSLNVARYNMIIDIGLNYASEPYGGGINRPTGIATASFPVLASQQEFWVYGNTILNHYVGGQTVCSPAIDARGTGTYALNNLMYLQAGGGSLLWFDDVYLAAAIAGNLYSSGATISVLDKHSGTVYEDNAPIGGHNLLGNLQLAGIEVLNGVNTGVQALPLIPDWTNVSLPTNPDMLEAFFALMPAAGSPAFGGGVDITRQCQISAGYMDLSGSIPINNIGAQSLAFGSTNTLLAGMLPSVGQNRVNITVSMDGV